MLQFVWVDKFSAKTWAVPIIYKSLNVITIAFYFNIVLLEHLKRNVNCASLYSQEKRYLPLTTHYYDHLNTDWHMNAVSEHVKPSHRHSCILFINLEQTNFKIKSTINYILYSAYKCSHYNHSSSTQLTYFCAKLRINCWVIGSPATVKLFSLIASLTCSLTSSPTWSTDISRSKWGAMKVATEYRSLDVGFRTLCTLDLQ